MLHFTFMSYSMPMTCVKEKMKHDFLHQENILFDATSLAYFFWHNRSHYLTLLVMLCSMPMTTITYFLQKFLFDKKKVKLVKWQAVTRA